MGSVRLHPTRGTLFLDFRYRGRRCREYTALPDSPTNRQRLQRALNKIEQQITDGTLDYEAMFPSATKSNVNSPPRNSQAPTSPQRPNPAVDRAQTPIFKSFIEQWVRDHAVEWRRSHLKTLRSTVDAHLLPTLGNRPVGAITREEILVFRSLLAEKAGRREGSRLSNKRINSIIAILKQVLDEAALQYRLVSPAAGIKRLKVRRSDVQPFSLEEVQLLLSKVRPDYRDYLLVRCFTGMRSGEVDGLQWKYIDFERRLILIRETRVLGEDEYTKTDGSQREIQMSVLVFDALRRQEQATRKLSKYVFCNREGNPIDNKNFVNRVWNPLLRHLGPSLRRPYQMRHTAATLWLAAGENPEWVARQLGHATTEMLFKVYSRYVPNLTRQDGSAFDRLLQSRLVPDAPGVAPWRALEETSAREA
jgi:integrase